MPERGKRECINVLQKRVGARERENFPLHAYIPHIRTRGHTHTHTHTHTHIEAMLSELKYAIKGSEVQHAAK